MLDNAYLHKLDSPETVTKNLVIAILLGVIAGVILCKAYITFLSCLFGKGLLKGHTDERFQSFWIDTSYGRVRALKVNSRKNESREQRKLAVLIHGYAGSLDMWADPRRSNYCNILSELGYDVLAYDLYGHGGSDCPDTLFSSELFASQLAELCVALDIREPFVILAHSMGSSVAVTFAHRFPQLVSRLVLICPSITDDPVEMRLWIALHVPFFREILSYFIIPTFGEGTNKNNSGLVRACYRLLETRLKSGGSWNSGDLKSLPMLRKLSQTQFKSPFSILILWGEADFVVQFYHAEILAAIIPQARFISLKEADHMSFADGSTSMKEYFADKIVEFLQDPASLTSLGEHFSIPPEYIDDVEYVPL